MKEFFKIIIILVLLIGGLIGTSYAFGWIGVHQTKTIGKAQRNANREVYEESQSYVFGKRQEAIKFYREYIKADENGKKAIAEIVAHSFAEFDESKLDGDIKTFIHNCKYNID